MSLEDCWSFVVVLRLFSYFSYIFEGHSFSLLSKYTDCRLQILFLVSLFIIDILYI